MNTARLDEKKVKSFRFIVVNFFRFIKNKSHFFVKKVHSDWRLGTQKTELLKEDFALFALKNPAEKYFYQINVVVDESKQLFTTAKLDNLQSFIFPV